MERDVIVLVDEKVRVVGNWVVVDKVLVLKKDRVISVGVVVDIVRVVVTVAKQFEVRVCELVNVFVSVIVQSARALPSNRINTADKMFI